MRFLFAELHMNRVFAGVKAADPPELPMHHQTHFTLEPSPGVTPYLEIGASLRPLWPVTAAS